MKLLLVLKTKHRIHKKLRHFEKFIFIQKWWIKKMSCSWISINIYYNKLREKKFKNSFIWEKKSWQKGHVVFFSNNPIGSLYPICTQKHNENVFTNTLSPVFIFKAMKINHQSCLPSYKLTNDSSKIVSLHSTIHIKNTCWLHYLLVITCNIFWSCEWN